MSSLPIVETKTYPSDSFASGRYIATGQHQIEWASVLLQTPAEPIPDANGSSTVEVNGRRGEERKPNQDCIRSACIISDAILFRDDLPLKVHPSGAAPVERVCW